MMNNYKREFELTSPNGIEFTAHCTITPGSPDTFDTPGCGDEAVSYKNVAHDPAEQQELDQEIKDGYDVDTDATEALAEEGPDEEPEDMDDDS